MMSSENIPPPSHPPDHHHHHHNPTTRKQPQKPSQELPQPPPLKCPRCDSANTKFCYYNNYSLTQPRHFCKTCRRYWTKGGALRNVPIGGGCRKTKKHKPSPSSSYPTPSSTSEFRFLAPPPSMDFQLGGLSLPRLHPATAGVYTQFIATSGVHQQQFPPPPPPPPLAMGPTTGSYFSLDLLGLGTYPPIPNSGNSSSSNNSSSLTLAGNGGGGVGGGGGGEHTLTISSIESLSTINQEMHWKLQQQRLALIYGPSSIVEQDDENNNHHHHHQQQQQEKTLVGGGIQLFKNMESSNRKVDVVSGVTPTEWLFDQIQTNNSTTNNNNYGVTDHHNNNNNNASVGANNNTSNNNNDDEEFNGVWATELHHHQFNGMQ